MPAGAKRASAPASASSSSRSNWRSARYLQLRVSSTVPLSTRSISGAVRNALTQAATWSS